MLKKLNPRLTPLEIKTILLQSNNTIDSGLSVLDAYKALKRASIKRCQKKLESLVFVFFFPVIPVGVEHSSHLMCAKMDAIPCLRMVFIRDCRRGHVRV